MERRVKSGEAVPRYRRKDFATHECDAHVTEPPLIWERAHEFLTRDKLSCCSEQYSGAELILRTVATVGLPHTFLTNVQKF